MTKTLKKLSKLVLAVAMMLSMVTINTKAANQVKVQLYAEVTDAGQVVNKATITYEDNTKVKDITTDTYTVHATASTAAIREGTEVSSYGDYDIDRTIEKVEVKGNVVTLYFNMAQGATLAYLSSGRNYPADLTYTVTANEKIAVYAMDDRLLTEDYQCEYTVNKDIIDPETANFQSVIVEDGINYQLYKPTAKADSLIVWFHGNGEGDYLSSNNNVAQMLANRGTVAWATDEAQQIFGNAYVMSFQAPDTWYYTQRDGLCEKAYNEIMEVVKANGIDPNKIAVSGCSAGGYMTTRMIIAYPELFNTAMINCPALDTASVRGGATPTDEELAKLLVHTKIWLVQGETDSSVGPDACSKRIWSILSKGAEVTETKVAGTAGIASGFTTYETKDGNYKLSLYETVDTVVKAVTVGEDRPCGKLKFAEDYNWDGVLEEVKYSDHWSWIYTCRNNPEDASGTHIWQWAAANMAKEELPVVAGTATLAGTVTDAGQVVSSMTIDLGAAVTNVDKDTFTVHATASTAAAREGTEDASYGDYDIDRTIEKVEVNGSKVTLYFNMAEGATLAYLSAARNYPATLTYTVANNKAVTVNGVDSDVEIKVNTTVVDGETANFESVIVKDGINYQLYKPEGKAKTLIVWFHGNGEGDYRSSNNNVAQMLANRGTVAWATDEAQDIFDGAVVMAFQAPDTWYYAQRDGLLEKAYNEIMDVVKANGIDPENIVVSGCSAGGYMTTRMIIAYPDLFAAAMINCPALDVASARGGETPTDEELATIKKSSTAIWLVQGEADTVVKTDDCSKRLWEILVGSYENETVVKQDIASDYTTYETKDGKYLLTLYKQNADGKLDFAEDYNQDGTLELVSYSNHWSWIYTLRNNATNAEGTHIWQWAASKLTTTPADNGNTGGNTGGTTGGNTSGGTTTGGNTSGTTTPTVGIYNNAAYAAVAGLALAAAGFVALKKKKED